MSRRSNRSSRHVSVRDLHALWADATEIASAYPSPQNSGGGRIGFGTTNPIQDPVEAPRVRVEPPVTSSAGTQLRLRSQLASEAQEQYSEYRSALRSCAADEADLLERAQALQDVGDVPAPVVSRIRQMASRARAARTAIIAILDPAKDCATEIAFPAGDPPPSRPDGWVQEPRVRTRRIPRHSAPRSSRSVKEIAAANRAEFQAPPVRTKSIHATRVACESGGGRPSSLVQGPGDAYRVLTPGRDLRPKFRTSSPFVRPFVRRWADDVLVVRSAHTRSIGARVVRC